MSYSLNDAYAKLAETDPAFASIRQEMIADWSPEDPPSTIVLASYAAAFAAYIHDKSADKLAAVLGTLEELLLNGSDEVKDAVATGFWERLMSDASAGRISFSELMPFIGVQSRDYCRVWDSFTGATTPGLE